MSKIIQKISFTTSGEDLFNALYVKLGKKYKIIFAEACLKEFESIKSIDHQYLTNADITRVANSLDIK